jgi:hypothetical protein
VLLHERSFRQPCVQLAGFECQPLNVLSERRLLVNDGAQPIRKHPLPNSRNDSAPNERTGTMNDITPKRARVCQHTFSCRSSASVSFST